MKFCGKCHKMKVKKVTNPNNLNRFCHCDPDAGTLLSESVLSRMRSSAPGIITRSIRKESMRTMRKIDKMGGGVIFQ